MKRWLVSLKRPLRLLAGRPGKSGQAAEIREPATAISAEGTERGWLKVLTAGELLRHIHAEVVLHRAWKQSRLAQIVWERDLLAGIERYAEFVQLMPASESHHHAHAGGLLAHTLETLLAAMTWRNGHFLPPGAHIEQIDAERDVWTYVVFFAALLHDIAKPMTDLRIQWRVARMTEALRWTPLAGNLVQLTRQREGAEYRVAFTPKSQRDYNAHSRLAVTLLGQIVPSTALTFLAETPEAMDVLTRYLSGHDKTSLLAQIVRRADQASTGRSLREGNRARFATARSVPLVELLMQAMRTMLKSGTELPLNRSGAAGWVYDGSVWFVAKRLADSVRQWIAANAPDEAIPGEAKNDRLFDTWQEYACIIPNPASGQAVWYVTVQGGEHEAGAGQGDREETGAAGYTHKLTMLRFSLEKLYEHEAEYPPAMAGRIEIRDGRLDKAEQTAEKHSETGREHQPEQEPETVHAPDSIEAETKSTENNKNPAAVQNRRQEPAATIVRGPAFNKPQTAAKRPAKPKAAPSGRPTKTKETAAVQPLGTSTGEPREPAERHAHRRNSVPSAEITISGGIDGFDADDGLLDADDEARSAAMRPLRQAPQQAAPSTTKATSDTAAVPKPQSSFRRLVPAQTEDAPGPVLLPQATPQLPGAVAPSAKASDTALAFITWLQQGLNDRTIEYNKSGALVHFTAEGMALVSPLVFKVCARELDPAANADELGLQIQREVIRAGWHKAISRKGHGRVNILRYDVLGRGGKPVGHISAVVLADPDRWVLPVPAVNPVLKLQPTG